MKFCKRLASFVILIFFSAEAALPQAWTYPAAPAASSVSAAQPSLLDEIHIPRALGSIQKNFRGAPGTEVILIQDAHEVPVVQDHIRRIISLLIRRRGIRTVAVEGAAGDYDLRLLQSFPDKKVLSKVLRGYRRRGELPGSVMAALSRSNAETRFTGVENWTLYEEGLALFLSALGNRGTALREISKAENALQLRKEKTYSPQLLEWDSLVRNFYDGKSGFADLLQTGARILPPGKNSQLNFILQQIQNEAGVNHAAAIENAAKALRAALRVSGKNSKTRKIFEEKYQAYRTSNMTAQSFAHFMKSCASVHSLAVKFPQDLEVLSRSEQKLKNIQGTELFEELETYITNVKEKLFRNEDERALERESRTLLLIGKLAKLELTRDEWEKVKSVPRESWVVNRESFEWPFRFYENAEFREEALFNNLTRLVSSHSRTAFPLSLRSTTHDTRFTGSAVMIAGGFHTDGLARRLREKNISYVVVMPDAGAMPEETNYLDHMQGNLSWNKYLITENGRIDLHAAFLRGMRDQLLSSRSPLVAAETHNSISPNSELAASGQQLALKRWRDEIILGLAKDNRIELAGKYTKYLDELNEEKQNPEWLQRFDHFLSGLNQLKTRGQLNENSVAALLRSGIPSVTAASAANSKLRDFRFLGGRLIPAGRIHPTKAAAPEIQKPVTDFIPAGALPRRTDSLRSELRGTFSSRKREKILIHFKAALIAAPVLLAAGFALGYRWESAAAALFAVPYLWKALRKQTRETSGGALAFAREMGFRLFIGAVVSFGVSIFYWSREGFEFFANEISTELILPHLSSNRPETVRFALDRIYHERLPFSTNFIPALVRLLDSPDVLIRDGAMKRLGDIPSDETLPLFERALNPQTRHPDAAVRASAISNLGRILIRTPEPAIYQRAVTDLLGTIEIEPNSGNQNIALLRLGWIEPAKLTDQRAIYERILELTKLKPPIKRHLAVLALIPFLDEPSLANETRDALVQIKENDPNPETRKAAERGLSGERGIQLELYRDFEFSPRSELRIKIEAARLGLELERIWDAAGARVLKRPSETAQKTFREGLAAFERYHRDRGVNYKDLSSFDQLRIFTALLYGRGDYGTVYKKLPRLLERPEILDNPELFKTGLILYLISALAYRPALNEAVLKKGKDPIIGYFIIKNELLDLALAIHTTLDPAFLKGVTQNIAGGFKALIDIEYQRTIQADSLSHKRASYRKLIQLFDNWILLHEADHVPGQNIIRWKQRRKDVESEFPELSGARSELRHVVDFFRIGKGSAAEAAGILSPLIRENYERTRADLRGTAYDLAKKESTGRITSAETMKIAADTEFIHFAASRFRQALSKTTGATALSFDLPPEQKSDLAGALEMLDKPGGIVALVNKELGPFAVPGMVLISVKDPGKKIPAGLKGAAVQNGQAIPLITSRNTPDHSAESFLVLNQGGNTLHEIYQVRFSLLARITAGILAAGVMQKADEIRTRPEDIKRAVLDALFSGKIPGDVVSLQGGNIVLNETALFSRLADEYRAAGELRRAA